jgi:hypothetical protein
MMIRNRATVMELFVTAVSCGVACTARNKSTGTLAFPVRALAGTSSRAYGGANKFSTPQGQELHRAMIAI